MPSSRRVPNRACSPTAMECPSAGSASRRGPSSDAFFARGASARPPPRGPPASEANDERPWSVVCFWIPRTERGGGVATALLDAAVEHARARGAATLEGYPVDAADGRLPSSKVFTGTVAMFARAGFAEFGRPRGSQLVVRRDL